MGNAFKIEDRTCQLDNTAKNQRPGAMKKTLM